MKLAYYPYAPFEINPGRVSLIDCGHSKNYLDLVWGLQSRSDQVQLAEKDDALLQVEKAVYFLGDVSGPVDLSALIKAVTGELQHSISSEQTALIVDAAGELSRQVLEASYMFDLPLIAKDSMTMVNIFKFAGLHFDPEFLKTPYAIIETVVKVLAELNSSQLFVLTNVTNYLSLEEFEALVEIIDASDVKTLIIEHSVQSRRLTMKDLQYYYIDADFIDSRDWK